MTQFDRLYREGILKIMNEGYEELNERTGHKTKIIPGMTFELDQGFPLLTLRKIPIKILVHHGNATAGRLHQQIYQNMG